MRTTASLAAFVTLMAVASSNGAPIGTPSGSSARSISRARGQLRSRNVPPMPPNFQDAGYTVDVPNVKCEDCRESEVKKVSVDATGPMSDMKGDLKDMRAKLFSADVQVPGVPSGTGSIDIDVDVGDSEDSNDGSSTRPQKHTSDDAADTNNNDANDNANSVANDDANDDANDGTTDGANDGMTDNGQAENGGKADPPAEQPPCDNSNDVVEDVRDELKEDSKVADDKAGNAMSKAKSESGEAGDGAKGVFSSMNDGVHRFKGEMKNKAQQMADNMPDADMGFHAEAKMDAENRQDDTGKSYKMPNGEDNMPELVTVSREPSSENPEDCEDETTVEMREGNPSVSTSVVRR